MDSKRIVFVLGAGASYGDTLVDIHTGEETHNDIPLINQFFQSDYLFDDTSKIERSYADLITYIREAWRITDPLGTKKWRSLDMEDVFTSLAIQNEFAPPDSDAKAHAQLLLNSLKRFIQHLIGRRSHSKYGKLTRQLVEGLRVQDSIISFNYDLLVDEALIRDQFRDGPQHYEKFSDKFLGRSFTGVGGRYTFEYHQGLYLKLHGSLNWFTCSNNFCPNADQLRILPLTDQALGLSQWGDPVCDYCEGALSSYLIPPLLNKPVLRDRIARNIWSNALSILSSATKIVVIGYSFPATDFYSEWLFRMALRGRGNTKVWIVNPLNSLDSQEKDAKKKAAYEARRTTFIDRLDNTITTLWGYDSTYFRFDQLEDVLASLQTN